MRARVAHAIKRWPVSQSLTTINTVLAPQHCQTWPRWSSATAALASPSSIQHTASITSPASPKAQKDSASDLSKNDCFSTSTIGGYRVKLAASTPAKLKRLMYQDLQQSNPRRAAQRLIQSWTTSESSSDWPIDNLVGHLSLLLSFRQTDVAVETVTRLAEKGFQISPSILVRLLSTAYDDLLKHPDKLALVVEWVATSLSRSTSTAQPLSADTRDELVFVTLMTLKRMGRTDWGGRVFQEWANGLKQDEVGPAKVWSAGISLHALDRHVKGARYIFDVWRARWKRLNETSVTNAVESGSSSTKLSPPDEPYTTMLNFLASQNLEMTSQRDPVYRFLAIVRDDNVPLTIHVFNSLLHVEVCRRRFTSFWGLWDQLSKAGPDVLRNGYSWRLAVEAKISRDAAGRVRSRRRVGSPLHDVMTQFNDSNAPSARALFQQFLEQQSTTTKHRPGVKVATKAGGSVFTTRLLNTFLDMFVRLGDWTAAKIVLESYRVHKLEPDEQTHSTVVVGVVRSWERDKLTGSLVEAEGLFDNKRQSWEDRKRAASMGGPQAVELIQRIVEQRKMRVNMWVKQSVEAGQIVDDAKMSEADAVTDIGSEGVSIAQPGRGAELPPAKWMVRRELRELGYLEDLLQRCQGVVDEQEWHSELARARHDMLPESKSARQLREKQQSQIADS
ncbi:hypothetical protein OIO90_000260 [Microbotryomycetes sp. JL221]|nr:hypothetical protein OIO90_000260 [Microbotryomycetes sp. JL221]